MNRQSVGEHGTETTTVTTTSMMSASDDANSMPTPPHSTASDASSLTHAPNADSDEMDDTVWETSGFSPAVEAQQEPEDTGAGSPPLAPTHAEEAKTVENEAAPEIHTTCHEASNGKVNEGSGQIGQDKKRGEAGHAAPLTKKGGTRLTNWTTPR